MHRVRAAPDQLCMGAARGAGPRGEALYHVFGNAYNKNAESPNPTLSLIKQATQIMVT